MNPNCLLVFLMILTFGCNKNQVEEEHQEKQEEIDTNNQNNDSEEDEKLKKSNILESEIPENTSPFKSLSEELEAKRLSLALREREIIAREQMISRLESESISKKDEMIKIKEELTELLDQSSTQIKNNRLEEQKKLEAQFTTLKKEHVEFIEIFLTKAGFTGREIEPERQRLLNERQARIEQLSKTIEGMNPASCAMMLISMDKDDAISVMRTLTNEKNGQILSAMPAKNAAELAQGILGPQVSEIKSTDDIAPKGDELL